MEPNERVRRTNGDRSEINLRLVQKTMDCGHAGAVESEAAVALQLHLKYVRGSSTGLPTVMVVVI